MIKLFVVMNKKTRIDLEKSHFPPFSTFEKKAEGFSG